MSIRLLNSSDYHALTSFLALHAETSMFLLSNIERGGLEYKGEVYQGQYWGSFDPRKNITGVLVHYWNNNLMLQTPNLICLGELTDHFKNNISRPVAGILGDNLQAQQLIYKLELHDAEYNINSNDHLYGLNLKHWNPPDQKVEHHIMNADLLPSDILFHWIKDYEIEALNNSPQEHNFNNYIETRVQRLQSSNNCWALVINNIPVSLAGFNATTSSMVQIGPVWTPPEHRCKGYCTKLLSTILLNAKMRNIQKAILFTDNIHAAKLYQKLGFKKCGNFKIALLHKERPFS